MTSSKYAKLLLLPLGSLILLVIGISAIKGPYFLLIKYHYYLATSKHRSKDYEGAISAYTQVLSYDTTYTMGYISRGSAYLDLHQYSEAIADYTEAITLAPSDAQAYAYRGRVYYELKDSIQALTDYNQAIRLDSLFAYAYYQRGLLRYSLLKHFEEGCADLKVSLRLGMTEAKELIEAGGCD